MPPAQPDSATSRFIIRSDDPAELAAFIRDVDKDPDLTLLDTIGAAGQLHTAVVSMSHTKASTLEQRFRNSHHLKIEPDRPLSLFGSAAHG